jgi:hypothetical protein
LGDAAGVTFLNQKIYITTLYFSKKELSSDTFHVFCQSLAFRKKFFFETREPRDKVLRVRSPKDLIIGYQNKSALEESPHNCNLINLKQATKLANKNCKKKIHIKVLFNFLCKHVCTKTLPQSKELGSKY